VEKVSTEARKDGNNAELPKLLVEKYLQGMHIQLWGVKNNFEYIMLNANCCGEYIRERFPLVPTETLKETLDRAILVATATFLQLAVIEVNSSKGSSWK